MKKSFVLLAVMYSCVTPSQPPVDSAPAVSASQSVVKTVPQTIVNQSPPTAEEDSADDCSDELTGPALKPGSVVMLAGDSLAVGMESEFKALAKKAGYVPYVHAKVGSSTFQWASWIVSDLKEKKPALVVVSLGTNDAVIYERVKLHPNLYKDFVTTVDETGAFIVWIGPPAIKTERIAGIDDTRGLIEKSVPIYFDSRKIDLNLTDGIHTTPKDYKRWMGQVWHWMSMTKIVADPE